MLSVVNRMEKEQVIALLSITSSRVLYTTNDLAIEEITCARMGGYEGTVQLTLAIEPNNDSSIVFFNATSKPDPGGLFPIDEGIVYGIVGFLKQKEVDGLYLAGLRITLLDWHVIHGIMKAPWPPATQYALERWLEKTVLVPLKSC
jgi:hypothetical protein